MGVEGQYIYRGFERFWHWSQAALILFLALLQFLPSSLAAQDLEELLEVGPVLAQVDGHGVPPSSDEGWYPAGPEFQPGRNRPSPCIASLAD